MRHNLTASGFCALEMVCAIAISLVLLAIGVTGWSQTLGAFNRSSTISLLVSDIQRAKSEAITNGGRGHFEFLNATNTYRFVMDYPPYDTPLATEHVVFTGELPNGITVEPSQPLLFNSRGFIIDTSGDISSLTLNISQNDEPFESMTVYPTGRVD